jgi:hypothetical protein
MAGVLFGFGATEFQCFANDYEQFQRYVSPSRRSIHAAPLLRRAPKITQEAYCSRVQSLIPTDGF